MITIFIKGKICLLQSINTVKKGKVHLRKIDIGNEKKDMKGEKKAVENTTIERGQSGSIEKLMVTLVKADDVGNTPRARKGTSVNLMGGLLAVIPA
jgi:hypothetical protein